MMESQRKAQTQAYKNFAGFLNLYESKLFETFSLGEGGKGKFFGAEETPDKKSLKTELSGLAKKINNPYIKFKYWIKEE